MKRVLKPGGKFYYMEHIIAQEVTIIVMRQTFNFIMLQGRPLRYVQQALMFGGWNIFFVWLVMIPRLEATKQDSVVIMISYICSRFLDLLG